MVKKNRDTKGKQINFNIEESPFFTPAAFGVLFIALVILFWDFISSGNMLHGSDVIQAGVFFRAYLVDYVAQFGAVPQWNPFIFGGMPYVEAFHGDIFYPLSFIKFFGSIYRMLGFILFWHIFLAGIFMYLCAREFKLSKIASLMSGIGFMFASYLISFVAPGHDGKIFVTTLFPLTILFMHRGFDVEGWIKKLFNFSMLGLVIGLIILSPHPQMSYFALWALALYASYRLVYLFVETKKVGGLILPASLTAYAVVIGLLLSAIQFYPGYKYTTEFSPRADSKRGWEWATSWSMHEEEAMSLLIPEFSGVNATNRDYARETVYWGKNVFKDNSESVGVVVIFIALLGFFFYRRKERFFFGGLALLALLYALAATTPVFKLFFYLVPKVDSMRAASMIMFLFSFSIALLSGMGIQTVIDQSRKLTEKTGKRFDMLLFGFPALMLVLALMFSVAGKGMLETWCALFYSEAPTKLVQEGITKLDLAVNFNLSSIQGGAWVGFLFTALAAMFIWLYRKGKATVTVLLLVLLIPVIDGVRFNKRFIQADDPEQYWSENPLVPFFKNTDEKFRVMNFVGRYIAEDYLPHFGIEVVAGYHGNQLRWYDQYLGGPGTPNQANPSFLNLVGAKYLLFPANQTLPAGYFGDKPVTVAANLGQIQIVKNENALPRVFLVDEYRVMNSSTEIIETILAGVKHIDEVVYLEKAPELEIVKDTLSTDSVWIIDYGTENIELGVEVSHNKLLVVTDNYYNAWHVYLDGVEKTIHRAYGSFRAVEIPAGTKNVKFEYNSERYKTGKTATWLTSIYLFLVIGGYFVFIGIKRKDEKVETE